MFRLKLVLRLAVAMALVGGVLFAAAGRTDLPWFWAYLAVFAGFGAVSLLTIPRDLLEERRKPAGRSRDNLTLLRIMAIVLFLGEWVLAGLDRGRFGWTTVPPLLRGVGLASFTATLAVWYWAMRSNPFFSAAMRIQRDRGHHVVRSGPYRYVRHPGYAALVLLGWGGSLALGSWWAALPHIAVAAFFVRRAALEDRMLREELEGYADYAAVVPYRLLPGVW